MKIGGVYILIWGLNNFNAKEWYLKSPDFWSKKSKNSVFWRFSPKLNLLRHSGRYTINTPMYNIWGGNRRYICAVGCFSKNFKKSIQGLCIEVKNVNLPKSQNKLYFYPVFFPWYHLGVCLSWVYRPTPFHFP